MIGQVFHELWQFETGHANARNLHAVLIRSSFLDYVGLRVKAVFVVRYYTFFVTYKIISQL